MKTTCTWIISLICMFDVVVSEASVVNSERQGGFKLILDENGTSVSMFGSDGSNQNDGCCDQESGVLEKSFLK